MGCQFNFWFVAGLIQRERMGEERVRNPTCVKLPTKWRDTVCWKILFIRAPRGWCSFIFLSISHIIQLLKARMQPSLCQESLRWVCENLESTEDRSIFFLLEMDLMLWLLTSPPHQQQQTTEETSWHVVQIFSFLPSESRWSDFIFFFNENDIESVSFSRKPNCHNTHKPYGMTYNQYQNVAPLSCPTFAKWIQPHVCWVGDKHLQCQHHDQSTSTFSLRLLAYIILLSLL